MKNLRAEIYIHITVHRNRFLIKQPTARTNYPNLFRYKTLHVSGIFSAHHLEFSTVHSALVSFMQVFDNQPEALIIPILFCYKTLHVSAIFSAHHLEFSTVHSALVSFMQVFDNQKEAQLIPKIC
jgi:hypothetical protein